MFRTRLALVALLGAALVFVASASAAVPTLTGTDGPGFTITLKKGKTNVRSLKAGKYKIVVKDLSNIHNFHLTGPGVNKKTGVGPKGASRGRSRSRRAPTSTSVTRMPRS
jgi:hypothetical protein